MSVDKVQGMKKKRGSDSLAFSKNLQKIMADRGLTIAQIAALSQTSKSVAGSWVAGSVPYDLSAVHRLSKSLGVPFDSLLLGINGSGEPEDLSALYDESPVYVGLCRVLKLVPKKRGGTK